MLKDDLPQKNQRAGRLSVKWRNNAVERTLKEEKAKAVPIAPKELEVGDVIENDKVVAEAATQSSDEVCQRNQMEMLGRTHQAEYFAL